MRKRRTYNTGSLWGLVILVCLLCFSPNIWAANPPTREQIRTYVRTTCDIVDASDQVLDMALDKSPLSGSRPFLDVFSYFISADTIITYLYQRNYADAVTEAASDGIGWAISDTFLGEVLSAPMSVASLAGLAVEYSFDAFIDQIEKKSWETQITLYIAARRTGMDHAAILSGSDDDGRGVIFFNGWLFSVGDLRVPPLGLISPDGKTQQEVYGLAQEVYNAVDKSAYNQRDKATAGDALKKILNAGISWTPSNPMAPANVNFTAEPGDILSGLTITTYAWNFGDGQNGTGLSISHYYKNPGTYSVTLTMTDSSVGAHIVNASVTIGPPAIEVSYPDGYESLKRDFSTPSSQYVTNYSWNYGDGAPPEHNRNGDHTYANSGYYTVTLTLTLDDNSTIQSQAGIFVGPGTRYIQGHTIYGSETWYSGGTYVVQGTIYVTQGATLTIEPGTIVKFGNSSMLSVAGTLKADGTADKKIVFTHITDDTSGGDTNGDGNATHPGVYQDNDGNWHYNVWTYITFSSTSTNSVINNAVIKYGGLGWASVGGYAQPTPVISIGSPSATVSNSNISDNYAGSISVNASALINNNVLSNNGGNEIAVSSSPTIIDNTITCSRNADGIAIIGTSSLPQISGNDISNCHNAIFADNIVSTSAVGDNTATGNQLNGIFFYGSSYDNRGILTANTTWRSKLVYVASGYFSIPDGITLTIEPGTIVKVANQTSINVSGTLKANGTPDKKIIFTHITDDTYGGDTDGDGGAEHGGTYQDDEGNWHYNNWTYLYFNPASSNSILNNVVVRFAGQGWNYGPTQWPAINISSSSLMISNSEITNNYWNGLYIADGSPVITNNKISANSGYGLFYSGSTILDARNNDWGDPSGPLDASDDRATGGLYNPNGLGNRVSDHVNYYPWTGMVGNGTTAVPTGLTGAAGSYAINLKWNANSEPNIGGYKIYFGTTSGVYGTPKVVGNVTTYNLTGLSNNTTYFIAISSLNSVGVESAKSAEITITPIYDATKPTDGTLIATPGNQQITLNWTAASDTGTGLSIISPYRLVRAQGTTPPANCTGTAIYQGLNLTYADTGLTAGQTYSYRLCATDNAGNVSVGTTASGSPSVYYPLTLTIEGTGTGVVGMPGGSSVAHSSGFGPFQEGTPVTLHAEADTCSYTTGFSGSCNSNSLDGKTAECSFSMTGPMDITARFNVIRKVFNFMTLRPDDLIQAALNAAGDEQVIGIQAFDGGEDIIFDRPNAMIILNGGYDCSIQNIIPGGMTGIRSLTIINGSLILDNIEIGGP